MTRLCRKCGAGLIAQEISGSDGRVILCDPIERHLIKANGEIVHGLGKHEMYCSERPRGKAVEMSSALPGSLRRTVCRECRSTVVIIVSAATGSEIPCDPAQRVLVSNGQIVTGFDSHWRNCPEREREHGRALAGVNP